MLLLHSYNNKLVVKVNRGHTNSFEAVVQTIGAARLTWEESKKSWALNVARQKIRLWMLQVSGGWTCHGH